MEADSNMVAVAMGFGLYWRSPPRFLFEPFDLADAAVDSMYAPNDEAESLCGLYSSYAPPGNSTSPDGVINSYPTPVVVTPPPGPATRNKVMKRSRRQELNAKLYALRSVVPNITKMDKASIIRDAIAYVEHLEEQERRMMLADRSALQSSSATATVVKTEDAATSAATVDVGSLFPRRKKMRRSPPPSVSFADDATRSVIAFSPPVRILEVQVSAPGESAAVVCVRCSWGRDAVRQVCRALEPLGLGVVTASIAAAGDAVVHTMFVENPQLPTPRSSL